MKFIKKDKNGKEREVIIAKSTWFSDQIKLSISEQQEVEEIKGGILFDRTVKVMKSVTLHSTHNSISVLRDWTCKEYEEWADREMIRFNDKLSDKEADQSVIDLIEKGCK